jgi:hypothetical protein
LVLQAKCESWAQPEADPDRTELFDEVSPIGGVTERSNAATEERLKSGHAVGGVSIV